MEVIRAQVVIPSDTAFNEDAVTNTFHFLIQNGVGDTTAYSRINALLDAFYNSGPGGTSTGSIASTVLPAEVDGANAIVKYYKLTDAEPRAPHVLTLPIANSSAQGLPAELAVCLTLKGEVISGVPSARRRGRLYIGPLRGDAVGVVSGAVRLAGTVTTNVAGAAGRLRGQNSQTVGGVANGVQWCVFSPTSWTNPLVPSDAATVVANGHVDNAPDIQRRRGVAATTRVTFA